MCKPAVTQKDNKKLQKANLFVHRTLEERAADFDGELGLDGECDWGECVGSEVWKDEE